MEASPYPPSKKKDCGQKSKIRFRFDLCDCVRFIVNCVVALRLLCGHHPRCVTIVSKFSAPTPRGAGQPSAPAAVAVPTPRRSDTVPPPRTYVEIKSARASKGVKSHRIGSPPTPRPLWAPDSRRSSTYLNRNRRMGFQGGGRWRGGFARGGREPEVVSAFERRGPRPLRGSQLRPPPQADTVRLLYS